MISAPRFVIAKHVPDIRRMEPLNIGVISWVNGVVCARFLGDEADSQQRPPAFVKDKEAYREWLDSWRMYLESDTISRRSDGKQIPKSSPEFIDVLKEKSKQQFMLAEGGILTVDVPLEDVKSMTEELFEHLVFVGEPQPSGNVKKELHKTCDAAFNMSLLSEPKFKAPRKNLLGTVCGVPRYFDVDYAFHLDDRHPVFLRVAIGRGHIADLAAVTFQALSVGTSGQPKYETCALIDSRLVTSEKAESDVELLRHASDLVIDVKSAKHASREIESFVGLA